VNLRAYLERRQRLVNRGLDRLVPHDPAQPKGLIEGMRYSLFVGGKRIRPILLMAAAESVGGTAQAVLPYACALEMIHTYSLVHDDLPAMDDDTLRRGKPTTHVEFGEAMGILIGDALLTEAFRIMVDTASRTRDPHGALAAIREIAAAAGAHGMVAGQVADMKAEGVPADLPTVEFIHVRKTGAMILASVRAGALLAGASTRELRRLGGYGERVGLAFQIADDILDSEGTIAVTGKMQGRDKERKKVTFPAVVGMPSAKERTLELIEDALAELAPFPRSADPLRAIARFIAARACGPTK
jgi:geranylgeranyl diphosphate synthase, type II